MKIAAFNMKNLGQKKVSDDKVVGYLVKIMSQYSIVVILEVMDKSGKAMKLLLEKLNSTDKNKKSPYEMIGSKSLGRDTYKEKYVCFYRKDEVELKGNMQYADDQPGDEDAFAREPFILRFSCPSTAVDDIVLIPVHTQPVKAEKELDELFDVVQQVRKKWKTDNIMILGDFNADGRYLSQKEKEEIRIQQPPFYWLIDDDVDTTTSTRNDNTYDRIVVYGQTMLDSVIPGSAKAFNFQAEFNLDEEEVRWMSGVWISTAALDEDLSCFIMLLFLLKALSISDHYPVEVELRPSSKKRRAQPPKTGIAHCQTSVMIRHHSQTMFASQFIFCGEQQEVTG
uniref:Deoxyribonuclease 1 like 4, tandem duplicate 2 n=1 Tax=Oryzias melastigma TaxID=30732 RepID=A0A3B3DFV1_ORYME